MAVRYVNTALASNGDGSSGNPWNRIPNTASGDAAGNTLSAGDTVNIQAESHTFGERLLISADNLTFQPWYAYGDGIPLELTLPVPWAPWLKRTVIVGQGMWTVRNSTGGQACVSFGANRVGVRLDGVYVIGDAGSTQAVAMGLTSTTTGTGNSIINSRLSPYLSGSSSNCIAVNTLNALLYRTRFDGGGTDCVVVATHANNGNRAGSIDRIIECQIGPANQGVISGTQGSQIGDELQIQNGTLNAGVSGTIIKGCYFFRNSAGKQTILGGGSGWNYIYGNLLESLNTDLMTGLGGAAPNGTSIMLNSPWGRNYVVRNVLRRRKGNFAASTIRALRIVTGQDVSESTKPATDVLVMSNLFDVDGGPIVWLGGTVTGGRVRVIGNTAVGTVSEFSGNTGTTAAAGGFTYEESENAWIANSTAYAHDWNQLSSAFSFRNNRYGAAASGFRIQNTVYGTAAAGLAAMAAAGCSVTGSAEMLAPMVDEYGMPLAGSPLLLAGDELRRYRRDAQGNQRRRHIGAFGG